MLVNELKPLGCGAAPGPDMDLYKLLSSLTWRVCCLFQYVVSVRGVSTALGLRPALCCPVSAPQPPTPPPVPHAWAYGLCLKFNASYKFCPISLL